MNDAEINQLLRRKLSVMSDSEVMNYGVIHLRLYQTNPEEKFNAIAIKLIQDQIRLRNITSETATRILDCL